MPTTNIVRAVQLSNLNEPIAPLAEKVLIRGRTIDGNTHGINVDPPYQREPVWGEQRKRNLIRSILMGIPIGALIFNERSFPEWRVCVDGKQRLLTVRSFIMDDLVVPAEWWEKGHYDSFTTTAAGEYVSWRHLTLLGQRIFDAQAVTTTLTARLKASSLEELLLKEGELFNLVNYGGVPQGERDA